MYKPQKWMSDENRRVLQHINALGVGSGVYSYTKKHLCPPEWHKDLGCVALWIYGACISDTMLAIRELQKRGLVVHKGYYNNWHCLLIAEEDLRKRSKAFQWPPVDLAKEEREFYERMNNA